MTHFGLSATDSQITNKPNIFIYLLPLLLFALTACGPSQPQAQKAYDDQLAAAKADGLPLSAKDLADQIPAVADEQNAALLYQRITKEKLLRKIPEEISDLLKSTAHPQSLDQSKAVNLLRPFTEGLELLTQGSLKPGCNFNRDWELGSAVLMPEFAEIKGGVKLLSLRAALQAAHGDHVAAAQDLKAINAIANQIAIEPLLIPRMAANALQVIGTQRTVDLAIAYPKESIYINTLKESIDNWPARDAQKEFANEYQFLMVFLDHADDKSYYMDAMGMAESELGSLTSGSKAKQLQAKADIIRNYRGAIAAFALPQKESDLKFSSATQALDKSLTAFPVLRRVYLSLSAGDMSTAVRTIGPTQKLMYTAILRSLESRASDGSFPETLDVTDLKTPIDAFPIEYKSDAKSITVSADIPTSDMIGGNNPNSLTFPRITKE